MKKFLLLILLISVVSLAAPAPPAVGINPVTNECGDYFAGDEFGGNTLPEGWIPYFYATSNNPITELGNCNFEKTALNEKSYEQICCEDLGLTYVGRVGYRAYTLKNYLEIIILLPIILSIMIILVGTLIVGYLKWKKKPVIKHFNKKAFLIGAILGVIFVIYSLKTYWQISWGMSNEVLAILIISNVLFYGTASCLASFIIKKTRKKR